MKTKIIVLQICFALLLKGETSICQTVLSTDFNNNYTPLFCGPGFEDWASCYCNGETWPLGNVQVEWKKIGDEDKIFGLGGTVIDTATAGSDFPFSHVFGYDPARPDVRLFNDWESYIVVDPPYIKLLSKGNNPHCCEYGDIIARNPTNLNSQNSTIGSGILGLELESALIPAAYRSGRGDRTVVFGDLISDCGHDDGGFHTEIHPPLMLVSARPLTGSNPLNNQQKFNANTSDITFASVISQPYHITQLYNDGLSFLDAAAGEMLLAVASAEGWGWLSAFLAPTYHLTMTTRLADKPFKGIKLMTFDIFPQHPKPSAEYVLWHQFHFTVRNGVTVSIAKADDHFTVIVLMNDAIYNSASNLLKQHTRNLDVRDFNSQGYGYAFAGAFFGANIIPGMGPNIEQGIQSTVYESPVPQSPFDLNIFPSPSQPGVFADVSDAQPFPIYGWITVGWSKINTVILPSDCIQHPSPLASSAGEVHFFPNNSNKSQLVTITNPTNVPIQLGKLNLSGTNPGGFVLQYKTIVVTGVNGHRGPQPPEDCSNTVLPSHGSCSFRVAMLPNAGVNMSAVINIPGAGACPLKIPVLQLNGVN